MDRNHFREKKKKKEPLLPPPKEASLHYSKSSQPRDLGSAYPTCAVGPCNTFLN